jgi:prophage regulatory protein
MTIDDEVLARMDEVLQLVPFSRNHVYRMVRRGEFPAPVHVGVNRIAWRVREVLAWRATRDEYLKAQAAARSARTQAVAAKRGLASVEA